MAGPALFQPLRLRNLDLANRIVIAPMWQYSAEAGCMTDWHLIHLGHLALSSAALLAIGTAAVLPEGRISWADVGLWNETTEAALDRSLAVIQLSHAGRRASVEVPWRGGAHLPATDPHGWTPEAPSPLPFRPGGGAVPARLDRAGLRRVRDAFAAAAVRAARLGLDDIQIQAAEG